MLVDVICVGDVWIWVGFWRRLGGSGFGSKIGESKVSQNGTFPISHRHEGSPYLQIFLEFPIPSKFGVIMTKNTLL